MPSISGGVWVLVIGPSGAGKDTLMRLACGMVQDCPRIVFAKRVVTRSENDFEDHETATEGDFFKMQKAAQFVMSWQAHGLYYGIPCRYQDKVNHGCTVVCNVSRTVVASAKQRLGNVTVVLVTAPDDLLAERIAARRRDRAAGSRTSRDLNQTVAEEVDMTIENVGTAQEGAIVLSDYLKSLQSFVL